MRGRFIVLEGIDGSGTTTQARRLVAALRERGKACHPTAEPSGGAIGRLIRQQLSATGDARPDPHALALLFAADRLDHVAREIEPALAAGADVVCDRYVVSSWAYQSLDCPVDWVRAINARAPWPDVTVWIDLPVAYAQRRIHARADADGTPVELFDAESVQARVARGYEAILRDETLEGVVRIDGTASANMVADAVLAAVDAPES